MGKRILWGLTVSLASSVLAVGEVIVVPDDYPTIQLAVDAAVDGDEIHVDQGTYRETVDLGGKGLSLIGLSGMDGTTIDGEGLGTVITAVGCDTRVLIQGMTIQGGSNGGINGSGSTIEIAACRITGNTAEGTGGGVKAKISNLTITDSLIDHNQAGSEGQWWGGGVYASNESTVTITDTALIGNIGFTGGLYLSRCDELTMENVLLEGHDAVGEAASGGGMYLFDVDRVDLHRCVWKENTASGGAAMYIGACPQVEISSSDVSQNTGSYHGAISVLDSEAKFINCIIYSNSAGVRSGAIQSRRSGLEISSSTIAGNVATSGPGGIDAFTEVDLQIENSILWGNRSSAGFTRDAQYWHDTSSTVMLQTSCVQGADVDQMTGVTGEDPMFVDPVGQDLVEWSGDEDFHCLPMSPCVDQGDDSLVHSATDYGGGDRVVDDPFVPNGPFGVTDMGAFEWEPDDLYPWNIRLLDVPPGGASDWEHLDNWLPNEIPDENSWVFWNIEGDHALDLHVSTSVRRLVGEQGHLTLRLHGGTIGAESPGGWLPSIAIGTWNRGLACELTVVNGTLSAQTIRIDRAGDGQLHIRPAATINAEQLLIAGGQVDGAGTVAAEMYNYGVVYPIGATGPVTMTCTKDYLQSSQEAAGGPQAGLLRIPIGSSGSGQLAVEGVATLGGTLWMDAPEDLQLEEGDAFQVLSANLGIEDSFDCIYSTGLTDDLFFIMRDTSTSDGVAAVSVEVVSVSGLLGFGGAESTAFAGSVSDAILHDMDVDGDLDIVLSLPMEGGDGSVIILLNGGDDGGGGWTGFVDAGIQIMVGGSPAGLTTADFDLDGLPDLAVANSSDDTVSVLIQDDSTTPMSFTRTDLATDSHHGTPGDAVPVDVAAAQFIAGGGPDLAIANLGDGTVIFYENMWSPVTAVGFELAGEPSLPPAPPSDIDPTDVDDDKGVGCTVLSGPGGSESTNTDPLRRGGGDVWTEYPVGSLPVGHALGDLNGDGEGDIVVANFGEGFLSVLLGRAGGLYNPACEVPIGDSPRSVTLGDLDGDGDLDVAAIVSEEGVALVRTLRNETIPGGPLTLVPNSDEGGGESPMIVLGGDVDGDAVDDLVTVTEGSGAASGEGPSVTTRRAVVESPCPADLDHDGSVGIHDLLIVIDRWGSDDADADLDGSGQVGITDILVVIDSWGSCDA